MKYLISLFTSTVRPNHRSLESDICELIFFSKNKFNYLKYQIESSDVRYTSFNT